MRFHQGDFNFLLFVLVVAVAAIGYCARADGHPVAVPIADIGAGGGSFGHSHHPLEEVAGPGNPYPKLMSDIRNYRDAIGALQRNAWRLRVALEIAQAEVDFVRAFLFPEGHPSGTYPG